MVFASGAAQLVHYDMYRSDDLLFGLGSGCQGSMEILLQRLDAWNDWQPLTRLVTAHDARREEELLLVVSTDISGLVAGSGVFLTDKQVFGVPGDGQQQALAHLAQARMASTEADSGMPGAGYFIEHGVPGADLLLLRQPPAPSLLLLGAGPDSQPVAQLASFLGWDVFVVDHRSYYAQIQRFAGARMVSDSGPAGAIAFLDQEAGAGRQLCAAVVMSHNLAMDRAYLAALAESRIPYIGLLGPASRRERILAEPGLADRSLHGRLRSPVGLNLGAATPEAIALSIIAEIQATLTNCGTTASLSAPAMLTRSKASWTHAP